MNDLRFDDVIVGGGSAGCVLANRLSASGRRRVLLIEAGTDTPPESVPKEILDSYPMPLFFGDRYIWPGLNATTGRSSKGASVIRAYEQGRVMGGGSSINVQSANRGLPRDYDEWRDLGARGWGWDDVLPYFRKLETDLDFGGPLHGDNGPIPIRRIGTGRHLEMRWLRHSASVVFLFMVIRMPGSLTASTRQLFRIGTIVACPLLQPISTHRHASERTLGSGLRVVSMHSSWTVHVPAE